MNKEFVHSVFEQQVALSPQAIAIEHSGRKETYDRLNRQANRIGHVLQTIIRPKGVTAVLLDADPLYIRSILGILKSGGVFMPMDAHMPLHRLQQMLEQSKSSVLITSEKLLPLVERLIENTPVKWLMLLSDNDIPVKVYEWKNDYLHEVFISQGIINNEENLPLLNSGEDGNYIFFTSGSTGVPKGIQGKHVSLSHFIHWEMSEIINGSKVKVSQLTPVTFDPSLRDIFLPLCSGGTLCMPDSTDREDHLALLKWLNDAAVTVVHMVPSLFRALIKTMSSLPDPSSCLPSLKYILLAGEPLYGYDAVNWYRLKGASVQLINLYGPTETTLAKFFYRISDYNQLLKTPNVNIPVGKPISNTLEMVFSNGNICKNGVVGEVYIMTPFMSKGYIDATLNEKAFVQNPLHNKYTDIVYKTGDLGRYLPDGNIELVGRMDFQVKINGVRVEIEEIEYHLRSIEKIAQSVVLVKEMRNGEKKLVCYYVGKETLDETALKEYLELYLPGSMIPAYFISLKEMPLLLNGKIDKKALPDPVVATAADFEPPATDMERTLHEIWKDIFHADRISVLDSFISLGGNSLNAIQVMTRINGSLQAGIRLGDLLKLTTIRNIAAEIDRKKRSNGKNIEPLGVQPFYELSFLQKNYWLAEKMSDGNNAFMMAGAYLLQGQLDKDAFAKALLTVVERHEILRTVFQTTDGELKQVVRRWDTGSYDMLFEDLRQETISIQDIADKEVKIPFDLENGPLFRTRLMQLQDEQYVFLLSMHHIISDGWSVTILIREILMLYNAYRANRSNPLKSLHVQYKDFAAWQNARLKNGVISDARTFWLNKFEKLPESVGLPSDFPRPEKRSFRGDTISQHIDEHLTRHLKEFSKTYGVSLFVLVTTALKTLLYKYTGQEDIVVGTAVAGRDHPGLEEQVGLYTNNLALRTKVSGQESFLDLLQSVNKDVLESLNHQSYPFDLLIEELKLQRDFERSPLFDVLILVHNFESLMNEDNRLEGLQVEEIPQNIKASKFDLSFIFWEDGPYLKMDIEYSTDIFRAETVSWFKDALVNILKAGVETPAVSISDPVLL